MVTSNRITYKTINLLYNKVSIKYAELASLLLDEKKGYIF